MPRGDVVDRLVETALNAMEGVGLEKDFDNRELLSAAYTIALRVTEATLESNELLRPACLAAAQLLLMKCSGGTRPN